MKRCAVSAACNHMISTKASVVTMTADTGRRTRTPTVCNANDPL